MFVKFEQLVGMIGAAALCYWLAVVALTYAGAELILIPIMFFLGAGFSALKALRHFLSLCLSALFDRVDFSGGYSQPVSRFLIILGIRAVHFTFAGGLCLWFINIIFVLLQITEFRAGQSGLALLYTALKVGFLAIPNTAQLIMEGIASFVAPLWNGLSLPSFSLPSLSMEALAQNGHLAFLQPVLLFMVIKIGVTWWCLTQTAHDQRLWKTPGQIILLHTRTRFIYFMVLFVAKLGVIFLAWQAFGAAQGLLTFAMMVVAMFTPWSTGIFLWFLEEVVEVVLYRPAQKDISKQTLDLTNCDDKSANTLKPTQSWKSTDSGQITNNAVDEAVPEPDYDDALDILGIYPGCSEEEAIATYRTRMRELRGNRAEKRRVQLAFHVIQKERSWA